MIFSLQRGALGWSLCMAVGCQSLLCGIGGSLRQLHTDNIYFAKLYQFCGLTAYKIEMFLLRKNFHYLSSWGSFFKLSQTFI